MSGAGVPLQETGKSPLEMQLDMARAFGLVGSQRVWTENKQDWSQKGKESGNVV